MAMADFELVESMLNAAVSMEMLADNLDNISVHSARETQFNSRDSLHSSSKYDSAFDSHYSEDTASLNSQVLQQTPCMVQTSFLPSILTPPLPYRVPATKEDGNKDGHSTPLQSHGKKKHRIRQKNGNFPPSPKEHSKPHKVSSLISIQPFSLPSPHQQPELRTEELSPLVRDSAKYEPRAPSPLVTTTSDQQLHTADVDTSDARAEYGRVTPPESGHDELMYISQQHRPLSDSSSTDDLISNDSTPTFRGRRPQVDQPPSDEEDGGSHIPLTPEVTIIYPPSNLKHNYDSPRPSPRPSAFPNRGTLFYQDNLTPQHTPNTHIHRHTSPSHHLPPRYHDTTHHRSKPSIKREVPKRQGSILRRLVRKKGSFKEEGPIKRRLPVKRSFSDRITYHIRKGWIDYEEDLEFISQPTHPRAVSRMIDKKAGKFHMVQLYKPPSGKYGIYISQSTDRKGIFISRFSDNVAAKFYGGLISPGDQIVRVDGKNLGPNASVDHVYDLMTKSNSVIFTVIPVCSRPDW